MRKGKRNPPVRHTELQAFIEDVLPSREPMIRIYRLERNLLKVGTRFRKQIRVGEVLLADFSHDPSYILEYLQRKFGPGDYRLRTVHSNGKYGPSRMVDIG